MPIGILLILALLYCLFHNLRDSLMVLAGFLLAIVVVGGMPVGPIRLPVVPAPQTLFAGGEDQAENPAEDTETM